MRKQIGRDKQRYFRRTTMQTLPPQWRAFFNTNASMNWFQKVFFGASRSDEASPSTGFDESDDRPVPLAIESNDLIAARQLIHSTAVQTALDYGIPARWLEMEVLTITGDKSAYFQLQITLLHWDDYLWTHSSALSAAVLKTVRKSNTPVARAMRAVLWRVAVDAGCPFDEMPPPSAWSAAALENRAKVRERINLLSNQLSAHDAAQGFTSTLALPATDSAFDATKPPSQFNGFDATQPFDPEKVK